MTNEEAKFVLHAYRANGADAGDPTFATALEQVRRDPALEKWFAAQQAFDRAMCAQLGRIAPPAGLREAILTGAKFSHAPARPSAAWWRSPRLMALAASLAVLATVGIALWPKDAAAQPALLEFALNDTLHARHEGQHGDEAAQFQALLGTTNTRLGAGVPVNFEELRERGCRTISFQGRDVLEVCFKRDGKWFHCYVARVEDFPSVAAKLPPAFRSEGGVAAGAWSDGEHIFVIASKAGRAAIERLI
ncbi:MAG: hypothetical protein C0518_07585 [Opitutus sp.]|nr:hypothetical protein [Opitutus sp.]